MIDLGYLARYRILPDRRWQRVVAATFMPIEAATRTRLVLHDFAAPVAPVLYASNSSQKYDFLTFRSAMWARDLPIATITKAKNYHVAWMRPVMEHTAVVPLASKGYVILRDATATLGRRPTEDEYRSLRDHLDRDEALPDTAAFLTLRTRPRDILGRPFDPATTYLRAAWQGVYGALLGEALRLCREAIAGGHSIHIYPEGTVSSRLGRGRIGAMMFAQALGIPVVPVGISGAREAFHGGTPLLRGGTIDFRFGPAYTPDLSALPADFRAFDPAHERRDRDVLQRATDDLMDRINGLLAPDYQRRDDHVPDGTRGTKRFL
jgi:1-acyl-sn-glycerol-3-phosphate acyltransferase